MTGKPRIARVFPRKTKATPTDALAFVGGPGLFPPEVDRVHVSVAFDADLKRAEELAREWDHVAPVQIGGPATGMRGEDFEPGMYLRHGYTITSRGCPNRCWFCRVWRVDGDVRELRIPDGWIVQDDNLLACSEQHVRAVFAMLKRQPERAQFTGGLEAARLKPWHVDLIADLRPKQVFFSYDGPEDLDPLRAAGAMLRELYGENKGHTLRCYVLIGHPGDTPDAADRRLREACEAGFMPMAMLWTDSSGRRGDVVWRRLQRQWANETIIGCNMRRVPR